MWWKLLSIVRRITFLCFVILLIINGAFKVDVLDFFVLSVCAYVLTLMISILSFQIQYKKFPNMRNSTISRIWREDFCNPIIEHSQNHYQAGARLGALWDFRNRESSSASEKGKRFFVRIFVYALILLLGAAIVYAVYILLNR